MNRLKELLKTLAMLAVLLLALPHVAPSAEPTSATVLVRMPAAAYEALRSDLPVAAQGAGKQVLDFGSFVWLEVEAPDLESLQATGLPMDVRQEPYTLHLGEQSFDPLQYAVQPPAGWDTVRSDEPDLHLVQFAGPPREAWLEDLRRAGLEPVQYVSPFTYIVWGQSEAVARAASASKVRWTGPFAPAYRVQPQWRHLDGNPVLVDVLLYRGADLEAAVSEIDALGGKLHGRHTLNDVFEIASFALPGTAFQDAAQVPGVYSIQVEPTDGGLRGEVGNQVSVNNVDGTNLAYPGYLTWLAEVGLDGAGVTMANVDAGVQDDHPDLANRLVPCTGQACGGNATDAHGTHTAGIMAADGSSGVVDSAGFLRGLGMAPAASLVEQLYDPFYQYAGGMLLLMAESYDNDAALSSNSWGPASTPQGYDNDTMQVDIGVRDADPDTPGNQSLTYVLSIMNGNGGVQTQGSPDEAKNILTVGSTKLQTSSSSQILAIDDLSFNTAHGPALDGRTIPHMVAPGCSVDSTLPASTHGTMCGTSMAAPQAAGAVALFIQRYRSLSGGLDPSPALIKATFLPVAHDLAGNLDADGNLLGHPFDSKQGWGRLDAAAALDPQVPVVYLDQQIVLDDTGDEWVQSMEVADPSQPVRLMLVWTDAPGHGLGGTTPAWNNDLDLLVEADGSTYYGNDFGPDGWSQVGGSADWINNTEGVFLRPGTSGQFAVRVVASNINSDGVPDVGDTTDQDFALVCYNCLRVPDYTLDVEPSSLQMCVSDVVTTTIQVGQILTYSQDVTLKAVNLPTAVTALISPSIVGPPSEASLSLRTGGGALEGDYGLVISGTTETDNVHTAEVDLSISTGPPPAPIPLSPADGATDQPYEHVTLTWEHSPQAVGYSLQLAQDPSFGTLIIDASNLLTNSYTHNSALEPGTCYLWRAMGQNGCGSSEWAAPFRFATLAREALLSDDMESGDTQWAHGATLGQDEWQLATTQSLSPSHAWYTPDADLVTDAYLWTAEPIPVDAGGTLTFWHLYYFEGSFDGAVLEISVDGGATWQDLSAQITANGYNGTINFGYGNPLEGRSAWVGDLPAWTRVEADLGSFAGQSALVRWRIGCDAALGDDGWYIDDVQITSTLSPSGPPTLSAIQPSAGSPDVRTTVMITGSSFRPTVLVMLGDTMLSNVTYVDDTNLWAVVPAGLAPGTYDLTVINGDCQSATLSKAYTVDPSIEWHFCYLPLVLK